MKITSKKQEEIEIIEEGFLDSLIRTMPGQKD
jgi:BRCT domain type II-containing protein